MTEQEARDQFVSLALAVEGLHAPDVAYCDAICLNPADSRTDMSKMSSCALVARGILFRSGLFRSSLLAEPYVTAHAVSDVVEVARAAGALRSPSYRPGLGDIVIVGGPVHVFSVVAIDGAVYQTIQGGERLFYPNGPECIARVARTYRPGAAPAFDARPVLWVCDAVALAAAGEGW